MVQVICMYQVTIRVEADSFILRDAVLSARIKEAKSAHGYSNDKIENRPIREAYSRAFHA